MNRIKAVAIEEIDTEEYQFPPDSSLSHSEKTLLENIKPIKILADRISNHNLIIEHKKEEIYEKLEKDELPNSHFYLHEGLIKTKLDNKIFIPNSLEGTVLAYCHLITGHTGWVRLYSYVRQKFFLPRPKRKSQKHSDHMSDCLLYTSDAADD